MHVGYGSQVICCDQLLLTQLQISVTPFIGHHVEPTQPAVFFISQQHRDSVIATLMHSSLSTQHPVVVRVDLAAAQPPPARPLRLADQISITFYRGVVTQDVFHGRLTLQTAAGSSPFRRDVPPPIIRGGSMLTASHSTDDFTLIRSAPTQLLRGRVEAIAKSSITVVHPLLATPCQVEIGLAIGGFESYTIGGEVRSPI